MQSQTNWGTCLCHLFCVILVLCLNIVITQSKHSTMDIASVRIISHYAALGPVCRKPQKLFGPVKPQQNLEHHLRARKIPGTFEKWAPGVFQSSPDSLIEHCNYIAEVMGWNPTQTNFFQALFSRLLKLSSCKADHSCLHIFLPKSNLIDFIYSPF